MADLAAEVVAAPGSRARWRPARGAAALLTIAVHAGCSLGFAEALLRVVRGGARPMLPVLLDESGVASLPPRWSGRVEYPGGERVAFLTGSCGERLSADERSLPKNGSLLVLGDSQALGWGRPFQETFGAIVAQRELGGSEHARLLGAPRMDTDRNRATAACYLEHEEPPSHVIVSLNLGNDLDELFLGRRAPGHEQASGAWRRWLATHSYAYLELILLRRRLLPEERRDPASENALFMLAPAEQRHFSTALAESVLALRAQFPAGAKFAVAVIPADYDVAGEELAKYGDAYDPEAFRRWRIEAPAVRADMRAFRLRLVTELRERGLSVADLGATGDGTEFARLIFERTSHHLTRAGHAVLADAITHACD